jgi:hypothetical protein
VNPARSTFTGLASLSLVIGLAVAGTPAHGGPAAAQPGNEPSSAADDAGEPPGTTGDTLDVWDGLDLDPATFGAQRPAGSGPDRPDGVADEVAAAIEADGSAEVIIRLEEQVDMAALRSRAIQAERAAMRQATPGSAAAPLG